LERQPVRSLRLLWSCGCDRLLWGRWDVRGRRHSAIRAPILGLIHGLRSGSGGKIRHLPRSRSNALLRRKLLRRIRELASLLGPILLRAVLCGGRNWPHPVVDRRCRLSSLPRLRLLRVHARIEQQQKDHREIRFSGHAGFMLLQNPMVILAATEPAPVGGVPGKRRFCGCWGATRWSEMADGQPEETCCAVVRRSRKTTGLPHRLPPAVLLLLGERLNPSELQPLASKNASGCWPAALTMLLREL